MLELLAPLGAAIAWTWHEIVKHRKTEAEREISEADRERSYSERLEARLLAREQELEKALIELMNLRLTSQTPEEVLISIINSDHGVSWATKNGRLICGTFSSSGRNFTWGEYLIGIGYD